MRQVEVRTERNRDNAPVVALFNLSSEQMDRLHPMLLLNGRGHVYDIRSSAKAHVEEWSPEDGIAKVALYFDPNEPNPYMGGDPWPFLNVLMSAVGLTTDDIPPFRYDFDRPE